MFFKFYQIGFIFNIIICKDILKNSHKINSFMKLLYYAISLSNIILKLSKIISINKGFKFEVKFSIEWYKKINYFFN